MRRPIHWVLSSLFSRKVFWAIQSAKVVENWFWFLLSYAGVVDKGGVFRLRDGTVITTPDGLSCGSIGVIYVRHEYGTIEDNSTIIDIGANIGVFSIYCATRRNAKRVLAFEPSSENYEYLVRNVKINHLEAQVQPFKCAVAAEQGRKRLNLYDTSLFDSLYDSISRDQGRLPVVEAIAGEMVDCITLKDVFESHHMSACDVLKLDCEGAEYGIIYGVPAEYLHRIKRLAVECHDVQNELPEYTCSALMKHLTQNGFFVQEIRNNCFLALRT